MHIWSERPRERVLELTIDIATLLWAVIWGSIGISLYGFLANLAAAGRLVRDGGVRLGGAGETIASALRGIPLVGEGAAEGVRGAFGAAADPMIRFGTDLERLLLIIAGLLGLLVAAVALVPWLSRYLPWRIARWRRLNAAARVIRRPTARETAAAGDVQRVLASRALHRLEYDELLEFTPDPIGDWASGRLERLAEAELDRAGLRSVLAPR